MDVSTSMKGLTFLINKGFNLLASLFQTTHVQKSSASVVNYVSLLQISLSSSNLMLKVLL